MQTKALFLDRDGVLNVDRHHVCRPEDFEWQAGIFDLLRHAHGQGCRLVVATNQSGIARGLFTEADFQRLTAWMLAELAQRGIPAVRVYHCPYHPEAPVARYRAAHPWRKPAPGMLLAARDELGLDLSRSIMVGDRWTDMQAGQAAGVPVLALVGDRAEPAGPALPGIRRFPSVDRVLPGLRALGML